MGAAPFSLSTTFSAANASEGKKKSCAGWVLSQRGAPGNPGPPLRSAWQGSGQGGTPPQMAHELAGLAPLELPAPASLVQLCRPLPAVRPIPGAGPEEAPRLGARPVNRLRWGDPLPAPAHKR